MEATERSPAPVAAGDGAGVFHNACDTPDDITIRRVAQGSRFNRPVRLGVVVDILIEDVLFHRGLELPDWIDRAESCREPLFLKTTDVDYLVAAHLNLWLSDIGQIVVESREDGDRLLCALISQGCDLPEIRIARDE